MLSTAGIPPSLLLNVIGGSEQSAAGKFKAPSAFVPMLLAAPLSLAETLNPASVLMGRGVHSQEFIEQNSVAPTGRASGRHSDLGLRRKAAFVDHAPIRYETIVQSELPRETQRPLPRVPPQAMPQPMPQAMPLAQPYVFIPCDAMPPQMHRPRPPTACPRLRSRSEASKSRKSRKKASSSSSDDDGQAQVVPYMPGYNRSPDPALIALGCAMALIMVACCLGAVYIHQKDKSKDVQQIIVEKGGKSRKKSRGRPPPHTRYASPPVQEFAVVGAMVL